MPKLFFYLLENMKTEIVKISTLKTNPNNPRIIKDAKFKKLVRSIKEFPQMLELRPIVTDSDLVVLGGNMRLKACKEAGLKEVPVVKADNLSEEQKREFIIKDNVGFGEWDWDLLANEWDAEILEDWGLDIPEFDPSSSQEEEAKEEGEKEGFKKIIFSLSEEQATQVVNALERLKQSQEFKYLETYGNPSADANALYLLATQWASITR